MPTDAQTPEEQAADPRFRERLLAARLARERGFPYPATDVLQELKMAQEQPSEIARMAQAGAVTGAGVGGGLGALLGAYRGWHNAADDDVFYTPRSERISGAIKGLVGGGAVGAAGGALTGAGSGVLDGLLFERMRNDPEMAAMSRSSLGLRTGAGVGALMGGLAGAPLGLEAAATGAVLGAGMGAGAGAVRGEWADKYAAAGQTTPADMRATDGLYGAGAGAAVGAGVGALGAVLTRDQARGSLMGLLPVSDQQQRDRVLRAALAGAGVGAGVGGGLGYATSPYMAAPDATAGHRAAAQALAGGALGAGLGYLGGQYNAQRTAPGGVVSDAMLREQGLQGAAIGGLLGAGGAGMHGIMSHRKDAAAQPPLEQVNATGHRNALVGGGAGAALGAGAGGLAAQYYIDQQGVGGPFGLSASERNNAMMAGMALGALAGGGIGAVAGRRSAYPSPAVPPPEPEPTPAPTYPMYAPMVPAAPQLPPGYKFGGAALPQAGRMKLARGAAMVAAGVGDMLRGLLGESKAVKATTRDVLSDPKFQGAVGKLPVAPRINDLRRVEFSGAAPKAHTPSLTDIVNAPEMQAALRTHLPAPGYADGLVAGANLGDRDAIKDLEYFIQSDPQIQQAYNQARVGLARPGGGSSDILYELMGDPGFAQEYTDAVQRLESAGQRSGIMGHPAFLPAATVGVGGLMAGGDMAMDLLQPSLDAKGQQLREQWVPSADEDKLWDEVRSDFARNIATQAGQGVGAGLRGLGSAAVDHFNRPDTSVDRFVNKDTMLQHASPEERELLQGAYNSMHRVAPSVAQDPFAAQQYLREVYRSQNGPDYATLGHLAKTEKDIRAAGKEGK